MNNAELIILRNMVQKVENMGYKVLISDIDQKQVDELQHGNQTNFWNELSVEVDIALDDPSNSNLRKDYDIESVYYWKQLFDRVNKDIEKEEDNDVIPYSEVDAYANQIYNLTGEKNWNWSLKMAQHLSQL